MKILRKALKILRKSLREFKYGLTKLAFAVKHFKFFPTLILLEILVVLFSLLYYLTNSISTPLLKFLIQQIIFVGCWSIALVIFANFRIWQVLKRIRKTFSADDFFWAWNIESFMCSRSEVEVFIMKYLTEEARKVICLLNKGDKIGLGDSEVKRTWKRDVKKKFWDSWTVARECGIDVYKSINRHASQTWLT